MRPGDPSKRRASFAYASGSDSRPPAALFHAGIALDVADHLLLPEGIELREAHVVMALQGDVVALAQAVADEIGEDFGAALLREPFDKDDALGVEGADAARMG